MATETDVSPDPVPEVSGITLLDDETIHHDLRPSWSNWSKSLTIYSLLTILSVGILAPLFIHPWLARRQSRYIVTSQRVIKKTGLIGSSTEEYRIDDIQQLQTGSGWLESLMGKGNISFSTGAGGAQITFGGVPNYKAVANSIRSEQQ